MTTAQNITKQARHLTTGETFLRWNRTYAVIANEKGVGGKGRSILATTTSGEKVIIRLKATETVELT